MNKLAEPNQNDQIYNYISVVIFLCFRVNLAIHFNEKTYLNKQQTKNSQIIDKIPVIKKKHEQN